MSVMKKVNSDNNISNLLLVPPLTRQTVSVAAQGRRCPRSGRSAWGPWSACDLATAGLRPWSQSSHPPGCDRWRISPPPRPADRSCNPTESDIIYMYLVSTESNINLVKYTWCFLMHMSRAMTGLRAQFPGTNISITRWTLFICQEICQS